MNEWISVEERLPEPPDKPLEQRRVIVSCPDYWNGEAQFGTYINQAGLWQIYGSPSKWDVTHWMPLPPAPEGEK